MLGGHPVKLPVTGTVKGAAGRQGSRINPIVLDIDRYRPAGQDAMDLPVNAKAEKSKSRYI